MARFRELLCREPTTAPPPGRIWVRNLRTGFYGTIPMADVAVATEGPNAESTLYELRLRWHSKKRGFEQKGSGNLNRRQSLPKISFGWFARLAECSCGPPFTPLLVAKPGVIWVRRGLFTTPPSLVYCLHASNWALDESARPHTTTQLND
jgi:hypothetical protein